MAATFNLDELIKAYDVRGVVPDPFSPAVAEAVGAAFARVVVLPEFDAEASDVPTVVVGNDMRESGPPLIAAFSKGLTDAGVNVIRMGYCSTDEMYFVSGSRDLPGAMFTASHNPAQYNGIKMCHAGAKPVGEKSGLAAIRSLAKEYLADGLPAPVAHPGAESTADLLPDYARFLRELVDLSNIRPLKVVIDAGNGMSGFTAPAVLGTAAGLPPLPLEIVPLYFELDGSFPNHVANPLDRRNLVDLQKAVVEHRADMGLAFDGDADRCFVVDENGDPVSPSAITVLVGLRELARAQANGEEKPTIIHNLITSQAVPTILQAAGANTIKTRVGHSFIKAQMAENDAVFGGEHSAHYYFRDFWFADTGMLAAMHVLAALGSQPRPLSDLAMQYEPYSASGEINSTVPDVQAARDRVVEAYMSAYPDLVRDDLDGVTLSNWEAQNANSPARWWFNLRASNTEPLLRLNVEAADADVMEKVRDDILDLIRQAGGEAA